MEIAPADGGRWQVRWDFDEVLFLSGESCNSVFPWLIPYLDGQVTFERLERIAAERRSESALREILDCLNERRLLENAGDVDDGNAGSELNAAINALGGDSRRLLSTLAATGACVVGHSPLASRIVTSLRSLGFGRVHVSEPDAPLPETAFVVAVETDCSRRQLDAINTWALSGRRSWMLTAAWNRRILIGPIFVPGETACYDCYRKRLASHRAHLEAHRLLEEWRLTQPAPADPEPLLPAIAEIAAAHVALELFHFVSQVRPARILGHALVIHPGDAELTIEPVLRIPWCEACALVPATNPSNLREVVLLCERDNTHLRNAK